MGSTQGHRRRQILGYQDVLSGRWCVQVADWRDWPGDTLCHKRLHSHITDASFERLRGLVNYGTDKRGSIRIRVERGASWRVSVTGPCRGPSWRR
jgi:hypothetical protein